MKPLSSTDNGSLQNCQYSGMVLQEMAEVYNEECYQILADFMAHPEKYLKENNDGTEEQKDSKKECKDLDSEENKKRKR